MSLLLNDTQFRDFTLAAVREHRPALALKKTRVSADFHDVMESRLRACIFRQIAAADGGEIKTLRPPEAVPERAEGHPWLICQSEVHAFVHRAMEGKSLTQVSGDYLAWCDQWLRQAVIAHVAQMSSVGKTVG